MNKTFLIAIVILLVVAGGLMFLNKSDQATGNVITDSKNGQQITLSEKDLNYYPSSVRVKSGEPVSITLDSSVAGCLRSFTIPALGVKKYAKTPAETIDFIPTKKGTFTFACSMGMGSGKLIVE